MVINMNGTFYDSQSEDVVSKMRDFFTQQDAWMRKMVAANPKDPYWQLMDGVIAQIDGLLAGYNAMPYQNKVSQRLS